MKSRTNALAMLLAVLALTFGLAACGGSDDDSTAAGGDTGAAETTGAAAPEEDVAPPIVDGGEMEAEGAEGENEGDAENQGDAEKEGSGTMVPTVEFKNGEPVGGVQKLVFSSGDQIRFKVKGDEPEEIHLHGYDISEEIPAGGGTVEFDFPAEIEGIFEAELEAQGVQILELQVNP